MNPVEHVKTATAHAQGGPAEMDALTAGDLSDLRLITENAQREGWIASEALLVAAYDGATVRVTATRGKSVVRKSYPRDDRWPFRLLRDLAWGSYRSNAC